MADREVTIDPACLEPGHYLDSAHPSVVRYALAATEGATTDKERAVRLFLKVRDGLRYDPYSLSFDPADYLTSRIAERESAYCVPKAMLLASAARAVGIPSRVGFCDVMNHLQSGKLRERMGTDLFVYHGYAELHLGGRWLKLTPAFNRELCERFGVRPLEFDGESDAMLQAHTSDGRRYMQYVTDHGSDADVPLERVLNAYRTTYPQFRAGTTTEDDAFRG